MCVCVIVPVCVRMSVSAAGEGLHCTYSERISAQASQTPDRRPSGDSPAELIVVSIGAAGKGRRSVRASRKSH